MNKKEITSNLKILLLVLSSKTYPSSRNKKAIINTWGSNLQDNFTIIFYESGEAEKIIDETLYVETDTASRNLGYKLLLALDWCEKNIDYDFIFRTNTSSYVNTKELEYFILDHLIEIEHVYCGIPLERDYKDSDKKIKFLSGAGIIFNKKTVQLILNEREKWDHNEWEDVSLGKLLEENNINFIDGKRQDIENNFYDNFIDKTNYHYRCRLDNHYGYPRYLESLVIKELNKILEKRDLYKLEKILKRYLFLVLKALRVDSPIFRTYKLFRSISKKILPRKITLKLKKIKPRLIQKYLDERI